MKENIYGFLFSVILFFLFQGANAQERRFQQISFSIGAGIYNELLPENVKYIPVLFLPQYSISLLSKKERKHFLNFYCEPQFSVAILKPAEKRNIEAPEQKNLSTNWEAGLNAGFAYKYYQNKFFVLCGIGSGPHYFSGETKLQSKGFIFSDNFFAGTGKKISSNIEAGIQLRFRHISNAGFKTPNGGIDNFLLLFTISRSF